MNLISASSDATPSLGFHETDLETFGEFTPIALADLRTRNRGNAQSDCDGNPRWHSSVTGYDVMTLASNRMSL